jgi:streptogramin lyase
MVRRMAAVLAACALLTLAGCGRSDPGGDPGGDAPAEHEAATQAAGSGQTLWATVRDGTYLTGLDTGSGDTVVDPVQAGSFTTGVKHVAAADGKVWLGLSDGKVLVVDAKTGAVAKTLTYPARDYGIEEMTAGQGSAYVAYGGKGKPTLVRLDAATYDEKTRKPVIGSIHSYEGMLVDGGTLWVLQGNGFELIKADAASLAVQDTVVLGQDPKNPTGPFKDLYGHGIMAQVGGSVWIIDRYNHVLIRVDKATLSATRVASLKDIVHRNMFVRMAANAESFFVAYSDEESAKVVRYDGATGEPKQTYDFGPGAARALAVADDRLYVPSKEFFGDVLQVDIQNGRTLRTFSSVGAKDLALA